MKEERFSRIRDQRSDVKVSPEAYAKVKEVKKLVEEAQPGNEVSMSKAILLLYKWAAPSINEIRKNRAKFKELTGTQDPSWIH